MAVAFARPSTEPMLAVVACYSTTAALDLAAPLGIQTRARLAAMAVDCGATTDHQNSAPTPPREMRTQGNKAGCACGN